MAGQPKIRLGYTSVDAQRALLILLAFEIFIVCIYCLVHIFFPNVKWGPIHPLIDLNRESAIPTWFSSVQLFTISVLLFALAGASEQLRRYLIIFGLGFMFLSMDEGAAIHEKITDTVRRLNWQWLLALTFRGNHRAWMMPYAAIALVLIFVCRRFFNLAWTSFRFETSIVAAGLVVFAIGGVGLELLGFYFEDHASATPYALAVAGEELLEMAGMSVVLYGTLLMGIKLQSNLVVEELQLDRQSARDISAPVINLPIIDTASKHDRRPK